MKPWMMWLLGIAAAVLLLIAPATLLAWATSLADTWFDFALITMIWLMMIALALWTLAMENDE